jgi:hypothetical protein
MERVEGPTGVEANIAGVVVHRQEIIRMVHGTRNQFMDLALPEHSGR